jgi:hypothetical protein
MAEVAYALKDVLARNQKAFSDSYQGILHPERGCDGGWPMIPKRWYSSMT